MLPTADILSLASRLGVEAPETDAAPLIRLIRAIEDRTLEMAARSLELTPSQIRLAAGEMSAQEMRTAQAVLRWRAAHLRGLKPASFDLALQSIPVVACR